MRFEYRRYDRPFRQPLRTHHGLWERREGVIVRLQVDPGVVGWGEIAPLPDFGTETLDEAIACCAEFGDCFVIGDRAQLKADKVGPVSGHWAGSFTGQGAGQGAGQGTGQGAGQGGGSGSDDFTACCLERLQDIESIIQDCDQFPSATQFGIGAAIASVMVQLRSRLDHLNTHLGNNPEIDPGVDPEIDPGVDPETHLETHPEIHLETHPETHLEIKPGRNAEGHLDRNPGRNPGRNPEVNPEVNPVPLGNHAIHSGNLTPHGLPDLPASRLAALLPSGDAALTALPGYLARGHHTFKLKIGIDDRPSEQALIRQILAHLPPHGKLRLDANGAFDLPTTTAWLTWLDRYPGAIDYLEQPLNAADRHTLPALTALSRTARTPIALDESVATIPQIERAIALGWPGLWIIKPAIAGAPQALRSLWQRQVDRGARPDWIFSSVFESRVGRAIALALATDLGTGDRPLGFGIDALLMPEPQPWPHILWADRS